MGLSVSTTVRHSVPTSVYEAQYLEKQDSAIKSIESFISNISKHLRAKHLCLGTRAGIKFVLRTVRSLENTTGGQQALRKFLLGEIFFIISIHTWCETCPFEKR